jgi:hypothetical protein
MGAFRRKTKLILREDTAQSPSTRRRRQSAMKTKTFDCIEMKRQGLQRIYEAIKDMTVEQKIVYWRERSREFREERIAANARITTPVYDARS